MALSAQNSMLKTIIGAIEEKKGYDIKIVNVGSRTIVADSFLICSSDSPAQSRAIADNITEKLEEAGREIYYREGYQHGEWIVVDSNGVMIHIFLPEIRKHYDLERFWEQEFAEGTGEIPIPEKKKGPAGRPRAAAADSKPAPRKKAREEKAKPVPEKKRPKAASARKPASPAPKGIFDVPVAGSRKELIEMELMKKSQPRQARDKAPSAHAELSRKEMIEQEIMRMKVAREKSSKPKAVKSGGLKKGKKAVKK